MSLSTVAIGPRGMALLNSTVATLTSGTSYTSAAFDVTPFKQLRVSAYADVASAANGLVVAQSPNTTPNYDKESQFTVNAADVTQGFEVDVIGVRGRIVYTNGGTNQATFRLYVFGVY